jgi:microsomal dipeptidase-like Zn-dependent dipeptidase
MIAMLENAGAIGNVLDRLDVLYGLGMRCMGLTHNDSNYIGSGRTDRGDAGLTHFGMQVVERMNELKILIDIAHASDRTIQDALQITKTHGDFPNVTRGLVKRGYSDDEIKKIIGRNALRVFEEVVG